ncbi:twin-arginine translocation signal domain-containing protein [Motiliproteus sediminis]|uniref:twin-arginine translocation signal domain-containing protein n=1 Tax=Motiliproteus sediminis TaxID=1468178 RepID=UPI001AEF66B6|nr:twin-arginine translocation signal domain-containing protein [Motiliproteus sediminis]
MSDDSQTKADNGRRDFLKTLGVAGGAVAVAGVAGQTSAQTELREPEGPLKTRGYKKSEHVRAYYDSCRN